MVKAYIRVSDAGIGPLAFAVMLLATLLTGFFWLGYWVSESTIAECKPNSSPRIIQIPLPDVGAETVAQPATPTQLLDIDPQDTARL